MLISPHQRHGCLQVVGVLELNIDVNPLWEASREELHLLTRRQAISMAQKSEEMLLVLDHRGTELQPRQLAQGIAPEVD